MAKTLQIQIRTDEETKEEIKKAAEKENRSISNYLIWLHKKHIKESKENLKNNLNKKER